MFCGGGAQEKRPDKPQRKRSRTKDTHKEPPAFAAQNRDGLHARQVVAERGRARESTESWCNSEERGGVEAGEETSNLTGHPKPARGVRLCLGKMQGFREKLSFDLERWTEGQGRRGVACFQTQESAELRKGHHREN